MTALIQLKSIVFENKWRLQLIKEINYEDPRRMTTQITVRSRDPDNHLIFSSRSIGATSEEADLLAARAIIRPLLIQKSRAEYLNIKGLDVLISPFDQGRVNIQLIRKNEFKDKLQYWYFWHTFILGPVIANNISPGVFQATITAIRSDGKLFQHSSRHQSV